MVSGVSAEHDAAERARTIRALLHTPVLSRATDVFRLVCDHDVWLRRWFHETCGWRLVVEGRRGFARLHKVPDVDSPARPPLRTLRTDAKPFDRRRYALFCVTAAALSQFSRRQVSLQDLSGRIVDITGTEDDLTQYNASDKRERLALVDVLAMLAELGMITTVERRDDYEHNEHANALYTIDDRRLAQLVLPPDLDAEESVRHGVMRRLLDDPVLHVDEVDTEQLDVLNNSTGWIRRRLLDAGLLLERRASGWCAIDPTTESTDMRFPQTNAITDQAALLTVSRLGEQSDAVGTWLPRMRLRQVLTDVMTEFPHWAKGHRGEGGLDRLTDEVLDLLKAFDLIRLDELGFQLTPVAGRFRDVVVTTTGEKR
ncbi:TIGR02678 family protein [Actinoalloteichus fjordicus]|uniref:DUF2398 family protein n=1 Tax=Actinoalloteichus fjordicus TaxID=1612552 RepID=A0AAC9LFE5_9PSEU|nr:TIGR02678 family protein [Actinoalloteichus fjordicus]APU15310.1 putative DUF2398 family protein [Actinoalloteichus fjordicus]